MVSFNRLEISDMLLRIQGKLLNHGINSVCAGGAPRELDMGRPDLVNDLDIFVYDQPNITFEARHILGGYVFKESCIGYLGLIDVADMVELHGAAAKTVQVIVLHPGVQILERLDFGLCQIGHHADGHGFYTSITDAYRKDREDKTLTLMRCDSFKDAQRSMKRAQKILKKYPDHKLVIPEKFKHLIA